MRDANWLGNVYHGLPLHLYRPGRGDGGYLAFLGRITHDKGVDSAIEIARRSGLPLLIAAKVDPVDRAYYAKEIEPQIDGHTVRYLGEIDDRGKQEFLAQAKALLFPIRWPEPFGLTMIESLATGTPVLALRQGSVPEIIRDGVTGFVADSPEELAKMVDLIDELDRDTCRREFERRFSVEAMADGYERLYADLVDGQRQTRASSRPEQDFGRQVQPSLLDPPALLPAGWPHAALHYSAWERFGRLGIVH